MTKRESFGQADSAMAGVERRRMLALGLNEVAREIEEQQRGDVSNKLIALSMAATVLLIDSVDVAKLEHALQRFNSSDQAQLDERIRLGLVSTYLEYQLVSMRAIADAVVADFRSRGEDPIEIIARARADDAALSAVISRFQRMAKMDYPPDAMAAVQERVDRITGKIKH